MNETKLTGKSKDIILDNISVLKELFPEIVVEDKIDFDILKSILGESIDDSKEKYSFTWPGKTQAIKESQKQSTGTLRPCKEESEHWDKTQNLYIEGDNLEVLKLLQKAYYNKIKCIYIDPPYNTGKDFIYTDHYQDNLENYLKLSGQVKDDDNTNGIKLTSNPETAGRFHTNWLNMMYPRLKLARNLLSDDGFIFISIDNNEFDNLKKVCDEIFGEENFITPVIPILNPRGSQSSKDIAINHEYIMIYRKTKNAQLYGLELSDKQKNEYNHEDENGYYREIGLRKRGAGSRREDSPTLFYSVFYNPSTNELSLNDSEGFIEIVPKLSDGNYGRWRWSKPKFEKDKDQLIARLVRRKDGSKEYDIFQKDYLTSDKLRKPMSLWNEKEINNEVATEMIQELFGFKSFDYTKSIYLISKILQISSKGNDIILDFFSGSSTTAHAVLEKNHKDNQNRKFIMIQIPEETDVDSQAYEEGYKNICEIGKERIRRAGNKIVENSKSNDLDIGFKVFKLDSSNLEKWEPDYNNVQQSLVVDQIKKDRTNEDLVYEIMLKYGIDLTYPIEQHNNIYSIGFGALVICLEDNITTDITNEILNFTKTSSTSRVVFKDSGFASDADKTNIKEIFKTNNIDEFITI